MNCRCGVTSALGGFMKYLFVIPALNAGGAERVIVTLANDFAKKNNEVTILTFNKSDSFYNVDENVKIHGLKVDISSKKWIRFLTIPFKELSRIVRMHYFIKEYKPDLILSFLFTTNIMSVILHLINRRPLIVSERNDPSSYNYLVKMACKYMYPLADCIVCQGENVKTFFSKGKEKVKVIPNPINKSSIPIVYSEKKNKVVVAVGRLIPQKNFSLLIDSFSDISSLFPDHTLEIYGKGPLENQLKKKIQDLGMTHRIKLMGEKKNVMHFIQNSELFVMTSNFEGFPNALVEAMASGLPVISTNFASGIAKEYISDNENGLVVPIQNRESLTKAMVTILSDKDLRETMSKNNKKILEELHGDIVFEKWNNLFKSVENK